MLRPCILVTGAAGYIGSVCVEVLLERGCMVLALDNLCGGKREAVAPGAEFVCLDLCDREAVRRLFRVTRIDAVMHFAALADVGASMKAPDAFFESNLVGSLNLLNAMVEMGVRRLVFSSSAAVYGEPQRLPIDEDHPLQPLNPYGESKLALERLLPWYARAYGLRYLSLRYFNAAGATARCGEDRVCETHLIPRLLDVALGKLDEVPIYGNSYPTKDGTCVRDYVHVLDIVEAHWLCLARLEELPSGAFNIGTGQGHTVLEVVEQARRITGRPIPVRFCPPRPGDPAVLVAAADKLTRAVGWRPARSDLETILRTAWEWRREHPQGYASSRTSVAARLDMQGGFL